MNERKPLITPIRDWIEFEFDVFPQRAFSAINEQVGRGCWPRLVQELEEQLCTVCFSEYLEHFGITDERYIRVAYDHFHGHRAFDKARDEHILRHRKQAYEEGWEQGKKLLNKEIIFVSYEGPFQEEFISGLEEAAAAEGKLRQ